VDISEFNNLPQVTRTERLTSPFFSISICGLPAEESPISPLGWLIHWRIQGFYTGPNGHTQTLIFDTIQDQMTNIADVEYVPDSTEYSMTAHIWLYSRVRHKPHGPSTNQRAEFSFPVLRYLTGQNLIDIIEHKSLHRYRYSPLGSGCLTWSRRIISELANEQYIRMDADYWLGDYVMRFRLEQNGHWVPYEIGAHFMLLM
jgi:hypothetical protein